MTIFVNYRREDSQAIVGRIDDRLRIEFGDKDVYRDIDNIPMGVDFRRYIDAQLQECDVVLACIGTKWVSKRLHEEHDWVRVEIERVLARDIAIIPVLLDGATMPTKADLPASLHPLLHRQAANIDSGKSFAGQISGLISGIRDVREHLAKEERRRKRAAWRRLHRTELLVWIIGPICVIAIGLAVGSALRRKTEALAPSNAAAPAAAEAAPKEPLGPSPTIAEQDLPTADHVEHQPAPNPPASQVTTPSKPPGPPVGATPSKLAVGAAAEQAAKPAEGSAEPKTPSKPSGPHPIDDLLNGKLGSSGKADPAPVSEGLDSTLPDLPSRDDVVSAMASVKGAVGACARGQTGIALVNMTVSGATGRVTAAEVSGITGPEGSCIAKAMRAAQFPKFQQKVFKVKYPFKL